MPYSQPRITVALPTYKGARHIRAALASVLKQDWPLFELLVVDDRSDDDTLALVRGVAGDLARVQVNSERLGLARNWNRCVELSRTPWVAVFHQDDVMAHDHLILHATLIESAGVNPPGMIAGAVRFIDEQGRDAPRNVVGHGPFAPDDRLAPNRGGYRSWKHESETIFYPPGAFVRELAVGNPVRCSSVTLNRAAHQAVGGFDPSYRYAVDWEFWVRIARAWPVAWCVRPTAAVRWHVASETHHFKTGTDDLDEVKRVIDAIYQTDGRAWPDAHALHNAASGRLARAYLNRAYEAARAAKHEQAAACLKTAARLDGKTWLRMLADPRLAWRLWRKK